MASRKQAGQKIGQKVTGETSKKNVRAREKALGTPKGQRQSATSIKKRQAGERAAQKRVSSYLKKGGRSTRALAKKARLSKTAAAGGG